ncbi:MAG: GNAT family N-acetyltransferase [Actinophytocola sp.]|uniref:GNAT family N-acetyltransferase n=1 Tax=Actinophytocola sp. TaxID=1872138 RepID=UPI001322BF2B|nr:GNAT family N-acetyltransferase [Actinophytocola sp.]MPZ85180.1 GNAT family N-acetyltransferase [Actinophytocola sp.]
MTSRISPTLAQVRYHWTNGTGAWATGRRLWASLPGRRFSSVRSTGADRALTIEYQGFPEGPTYALSYLAEQQAALCGPPSTVDGPPVTWRRMRGGLSAPDADLVLLGCARRRAFALPTAHAVVLPFNVHMVLDITGDAQAMYRTVSTNERRQFTKLRRTHQWTAEVGDSEADLEFFYERMHLPTMAVRHGEGARSADWKVALHALFHKGLLLFVNESDKRVAGVLCRLEDGHQTLRMRLLGVLDGDETHYRSGAVKAVYYLAMEWAAGNGVRRIDFSSADPFPGKGVFQFKRRFHPAVVLAGNHYGGRRVYLRAARDTPLIRDLLVATPMLTVDKSDQLVTTHFFDGTRPARTDIRCDGPGVHGARTVDLDEFLSGLPVVEDRADVNAER